MKVIALHKAKEHLELAEVAAEKLSLENGYKAYEQAWSQFLTQVSRFYSKMEQGSKGCGKSESWFGRKKHERRKDPLLSYLHHARDSDEHGIDFVTELKLDDGRIAFPPSKEARFSAWVKFNTDGTMSVKDAKVETPAGEFTNFESDSATVELVTVRDSRFNDTFDPPEEHLGQPMEAKSPPVVAALAIRYLRSFLEEASLLPQQYPADAKH